MSSLGDMFSVRCSLIYDSTWQVHLMILCGNKDKKGNTERKILRVTHAHTNYSGEEKKKKKIVANVFKSMCCVGFMVYVCVFYLSYVWERKLEKSKANVFDIMCWVCIIVYLFYLCMYGRGN